MKANTKTKKKRPVADILNDIHEGYPVKMEEALRVISHLEDRLEGKRADESKRQHGEMMEVLRQLKKEFEEQSRQAPQTVQPPWSFPIMPTTPCHQQPEIIYTDTPRFNMCVGTAG